MNPFHTIQLTSGQFIVCHGDLDDAAHRVCKISSDGHDITYSHGGQQGSHIGQYNMPHHLAVDDNGFMFVVDINNRRVTLLSPTLGYIRQVVSRDQVKWRLTVTTYTDVVCTLLRMNTRKASTQQDVL